MRRRRLRVTSLMSKNVNNDVTLNERLFNEDLSITNDDPRLKYIFTASKNHNGMKMSFRADMLCQENIKGFYVQAFMFSWLC